MPVSFHEQTPVSLQERKRLKAFIPEIFRFEGQQLDLLSIIFCTDEYLKSINVKFLQHDYYTDIITFNLSLPSANAISGEIYISIDRVNENAIIHNESFKSELHRVIFHGVLHLCGYKDKANKAKTLMTEKENLYLSRYI